MTQVPGPLYVGKSASAKGGQGMFLASKTVETGVFFAFLISGMFVASLQSFAVGSEPSEEALAVVRQNDVKKMQQALHDRGQYRGKVDGVIGLRTRASIRSFQKTENLPTTGQLDSRTASKLGIKPESIRSTSNHAQRDIVEGQEQPGNQAAKGKPWAGTRLAKGTRRTRKTLPKIVPTGADPTGREIAKRDFAPKTKSNQSN
jgi:peptidoglycan hydrolase-like protein with peptidoglycan-binding domain